MELGRLCLVLYSDEEYRIFLAITSNIGNTSFKKRKKSNKKIKQDY